MVGGGNTNAALDCLGLVRGVVFPPYLQLKIRLLYIMRSIGRKFLGKFFDRAINRSRFWGPL